MSTNGPAERPGMKTMQSVPSATAHAWGRTRSFLRRATAPQNPIGSRIPRLSRVGLRGQRGSAIVEFAVTLMPVLILTLGMCDFGRGVWSYNTLSYAAREGARYAIVHGEESPNPASTSKIEEIVENWAVGLSPEYLTVQTSWQPDNSSGSTVVVEVNYDFQTVVPILPSGITLSSTARMVVLY